MRENETDMTTNADDPTNGTDAATPLPTEPATAAEPATQVEPAESAQSAQSATSADDADTLVIPSAGASSEPAARPEPPAAPIAPEAVAAPAEPWLSVTVPAVPPRPALSGPPPMRWGGIVWGLLLVLFAAGTLAVVSSPARLAGVTVWIATLTPGAAIAVWIAVLGLIIVVSALLGAVSAAQRNRRRQV